MFDPRLSIQDIDLGIWVLSLQSEIIFQFQVRINLGSSIIIIDNKKLRFNGFAKLRLYLERGRYSFT